MTKENITNKSGFECSKNQEPTIGQLRTVTDMPPCEWQEPQKSGITGEPKELGGRIGDGGWLKNRKGLLQFSSLNSGRYCVRTWKPNLLHVGVL